jgi:hypothetical protein
LAGSRIALRNAFCCKGDGGTEIDPNKVRLALEDAAHRAIRICEQQKDGTVRGTEGTGEFERYTPAEYIEAVRKVIGEKGGVAERTCEVLARWVSAVRRVWPEPAGRPCLRGGAGRAPWAAAKLLFLEPAPGPKKEARNMRSGFEMAAGHQP